MSDLLADLGFGLMIILVASFVMDGPLEKKK